MERCLSVTPFSVYWPISVSFDVSGLSSGCPELEHSHSAHAKDNDAEFRVLGNTMVAPNFLVAKRHGLN